MKVLVASSERFAGCLVDALIRNHHQVVGVISPLKGIFERQHQGSRVWLYRFRGWDILPLCRRKNIPFRVSRRLDDGSVTAFIKESRADVLVLFGWPTRVGPQTLNLFPRGGMNIHPSLLPKLRGADPLFHMIDRGQACFGLSFHEIVASLDSGPIYLQVPLPQGPEDTYDDLYFKALEGTFLWLPKALSRVERGPAEQHQQGEPSVAVKFRGRFRLLDPAADWLQIRRRTLACYSHHTMLTAIGGRLLHFTQCRLSTRAPTEKGQGSIQKVAWFSMQINLAGRRMRLGGIRVHGLPRWLTPFVLRRIAKPGAQLDSVQKVRSLAREHKAF